MKIVAPPYGMKCDECKEMKPYVVEFDEQGELAWLCADCIERAWRLIETHEEAIFAKTHPREAS